MTGLNTGAIAASKVYVGAIAASKVYLGSTQVWAPAPAVPSPVSHFDFHEGSGGTATSLVGGYSITGSIGWVTGGITSGSLIGDVAPSGTQTEWSVAYEVTFASYPGSAHSLGNAASGNPYTNYDGSGHPGPYPPEQYGTTAIPLSTRTTVVYVFTATDSKVYVAGALSGTFANTHPASLLSYVIHAEGGITIHDAKFWLSALTGPQVAAL